MLLYFDYNGKLKAQIEHGYPPRQGSDLPITVCLPLDFWEHIGKDKNSYTKTIEFIVGGTVSQVYDLEESTYTFHKTHQCETTNGFIDGEKYLSYSYEVIGDSPIVANAGEIFAVVKFVKTEETEIEGEITTEVVDVLVNGRISIFLERTYSNAKQRVSGELLIKYSDIVNRINATQGEIPKNIKDEPNVGGGLKQYSVDEDTTFTNEVDSATYEVGAFGECSFVQGCLSHAGAGAEKSFVGGNKSVVKTKYSFNFSDNSIIDGIALHFNNAILGGSQNYMYFAKNSVILGGENNKIDGTNQGYTRANDLIFGTDNIIETNNAIALGCFLYVNKQYQMAICKYNATDSDALFIIGNGTSDEDRKNAFVIKTDGSARLQTQGTTSDSVVRKDYVDDIESDLSTEIDTKLDRDDTPNSGNRVYGILNNGTQTKYVVQQSPYENTIVQRDSNGNVKTSVPASENDATPKSYVDGKFSDAKNYTDSAATGALSQAKNYTDQQIQELKDNPDVVDIVATYADLLSYDTTNLGNKDIIRVLSDESQQGGGKSTYYKWNYPNSGWNFVGMLTGESGTTVYVDNVSQPTWNADTKLDKKTSSGTAVYAANGQNQVMMGVSIDAASGSIAQRDMSGRLKVAPPTEDTHAANKAYVDDIESDLSTEIDTKIDKATDVTANNQAYVKTAGGSQTLFDISTAATASTIAYRDSSGALNVGTPTQNGHAATKLYVDSMFIKVITMNIVATDIAGVYAPQLTVDQIATIQTAVSQGKQVYVELDYAGTTHQFNVLESDHDDDESGIRFTYYNNYLTYTVTNNTVSVTCKPIGGGGEIEVIGYGR